MRTAGLFTVLTLICELIIACADQKHSGQTLSDTLTSPEHLFCNPLMSQSEASGCDQGSTDSTPRPDPSEPTVDDNKQTQESPSTQVTEEVSTPPEDTETKEVSSDADTTGNCPFSRSGQEEEEGRGEARGLLPNPAETFPDTLDAFGYFFDKDGRMKEIGTNAPFDFHYAPNDPSFNQKRYEALGEVVTEHVYMLLEEQGRLKRVTVPIDPRRGEETTFFFMSEDALTNPDRLLVLIHGSGAVRAGQWARRLIINDCLDSGTQLPFIKKARENGYGVVVMNTNDNSRRSKDGRYMSIRGNGSPDDHAQYVWDNFVDRSAAKRIDIVAHSYGGCITVTLAEKYFKMFEKRVGKIAFTDSAHSLGGFFGPSKSVCRFLMAKSINWVSSYEPLGEWLTQGDDGRVPRVSAGTMKHEETSWCAFEEIFTWFLAADDEEDEEEEESMDT